MSILADKLTHLKQEDVLALAMADTQLRRQGTYWEGPCPFCGGDDRFVVKPSSNSWYCRHCSDGKYRDAVDYLAAKRGQTSAEFLRDGYARPVVVKPALPPPVAPEVDRAAWFTAACEFVSLSERRLWEDEGKKAHKWLTEKRGLTDATIAAWSIGWNPEDVYGDAATWGTGDKVFLPRGIVIPCQPDRLRYVKVRRFGNFERRYLMLRGSTSWLFGAETLAGAMQAFIFESELDAILAHQEWASDGLGFCSFPAGGPWQPAWTCYAAGIERFLVAMDNDEAGQKAAKMLTDLSPRMVRVAYPEGVKDLGDLYQHGGNVLDWLYEVMG